MLTGRNSVFYVIAVAGVLWGMFGHASAPTAVWPWVVMFAGALVYPFWFAVSPLVSKDATAGGIAQGSSHWPAASCTVAFVIPGFRATVAGAGQESASYCSERRREDRLPHPPALRMRIPIKHA